MKDSRRNFIKKLSLMGATTLTAPQILAAKDHKNEYNVPVSKTFLFQGDSITEVDAAITRIGTIYSGKDMFI